MLLILLFFISPLLFTFSTALSYSLESANELPRPSVIELNGSNAVGFVRVMCKPARALTAQPLRCVL